MRKVKIAIAGLGQRGGEMYKTIIATNKAEICALCDVYEDRVENAYNKIIKLQDLKPKKYLDYNKMIKAGGFDAIYIATPWKLHIPMAIKALKKHIIVAMEVCGAYSIKQCQKLVETYEQTKTPFMFMENCCFDKFELLVTNMARENKFGEIVYCHGSYSHDLRSEVVNGRVNRHYRLDYYRDYNCENYPTHDLGPIAKILNINCGNRFVSLVSVASKAVGINKYTYSDGCKDPNQRGVFFKQGDIINTLIKCENGELISLTLDTNLPRYYSREMQIRGDLGLANQEDNMILFESDNLEEFFDTPKTIEKNVNNATKYYDYLPPCWKDITPEQLELGHGGMDFIMFEKFLDCILNNTEMPIDVYDATSWMIVSYLSQKSIEKNGKVMYFPDFTNGKWKSRTSKPVL